VGQATSARSYASSIAGDGWATNTGSGALALAMPSGPNSRARANARVDTPLASATTADSSWEVALL
jgi:hypothetical protein